MSMQLMLNNLQRSRTDVMNKRIAARWWKNVRWIRTQVKSVAYVVGIVGITLATTNCSDQVTQVPHVSTDQLLMDFRINPRGLTMAIGEHEQLTPTARNLLGTPIPIPDSLPPQFVSQDSTIVRVTPSGELIARAETPTDPYLGRRPIWIAATWTYGTVTTFDTIYVAVSPIVPADPVASFSVQPSPYPMDSTWGGYGFPLLVSSKVVTVTGDTLSDVYSYFYTERTKENLSEIVGPYDRGLQMLYPPGERFWIYATSMVYGKLFTDSVQYLVLDNFFRHFNVMDNGMGGLVPEGGGIGGFIRLTSCGWAIFSNQLPVAITITFDSAAATSECVPGDETGNIVALQPNGTAIRKFKASGSYIWRVKRDDGVPLTAPDSGIIQIRDRTMF